MANIHLTDPQLFGNEAAENEDPKALRSYFVDKPEFNSFEDRTVPLQIARARKGMGKSALLAYVSYLKRFDTPPPLIISIIGADLANQGNFPSGGANDLICDWQQRICSRINAELGRSIGLAFTDTQISLVEYSEIAGFKGRNLIRALLDRVKLKGLPVEATRLSPADQQQLLSRHLNASQDRIVWIFIDDIDATFHRTPEESLRLSTFFTACRMLAASLKGLVIRTSVRKDVWASIRGTDEALDKCEQYMVDIEWSRNGTRSILANRVASYLLMQSSAEADVERRRLIEAGIVRPASVPRIHDHKDEDEALEMIFPQRFRWEAGIIQPFHVIHVLSAGRPRWALQLCKLAAREAQGTGSNIIQYGFIKQVLAKYGGFRIDDLLREHGHQCPEIESIIAAFNRQQGRFTTAELLAFIETAILRHLEIHIDNIGPERSSLRIAHFLFRIGFISGSERRSTLGMNYYRYEEKPHLLRTVTNIDEGLSWDIHPAYRAALQIELRN